MDYLSRCADGVVTDALAAMGGVLLEGPRGCGKTSTGLQHARSSVRLDRDPQLVQLARDAPGTILEGLTPRLIDEWQLAPTIWNAARHEIDDRHATGQFIFSGSAVPADDETRHTGAGRFARIRMRTMSFAESRVSSGAISLSRLLDGTVSSVSARSDVSYAELVGLATRGGWPSLVHAAQAAAEQYNLYYCNDLLQLELQQATGEKRNPERISRVFRVLARNLAGELNISKLTAEVGADGRAASDTTVRADLDALKRVFAYDPVPAWSVDLRSRARIRQREKIHLADPALAAALLGASAEKLLMQREYFGFIFESMVVRDLRAYASAERGQVYHYRDNSDLEIDVVLDYGSRWAAIEVKVGAGEFDKAEANLLKLAREKVDTDRVGEPAFLAIVTGTEYAYTLPSGVHVIPLATLTW